jgi:hypothetical protein
MPTPKKVALADLAALDELDAPTAALADLAGREDGAGFALEAAAGGAEPRAGAYRLPSATAGPELKALARAVEESLAEAYAGLEEGGRVAASAVKAAAAALAQADACRAEAGRW